MSQYVETPTKTFSAGAAIAQFLRVKLSAGVLAAADASDVSLGVMDAPALASGDKVPVRLRNAQGTRKMVAVAAITAGNPVYAAAGGKVDASGTVIEGTALEAATADGDVIEVLPIGNSDISSSISGTTAATFQADNDSGKPRIAIGSQTGGTGNYTHTLLPPATLTGNRTLTLPSDGNTTLVDNNADQIVTNKRIGVATVVVGGTAIGNANAVAEGFTLVTGADNTAAVKLPTAAAGVVVHIKNAEPAKLLKVFPAVNAKINNAAANAVYNQTNGAFRTFVAYNATDWFTHPETIA